MFEPMKYDGTCGTCTFYRWQFEDCLACSENGSPVVGNEPCRYPAERHVAIPAQCPADLVPVERGLLQELIEAFEEPADMNKPNPMLQHFIRLGKPMFKLRALLDQAQAQEVEL